MDQEKSSPADQTEKAVNANQSSHEANADTQPNERGASEGSSSADSLRAELEALKAENKELKEKSLRLMAEMENLRRRTERDKSEFSKYANSEFAKDMLSVADNMRRAIEAVPEEAIEQDSVLRSLVEGVQVTEKELLKTFEKYQVKRFDPTGEPFNPHLHDAMTRIEVPNVPADTVVQVIQAGYMIGERVLRPASVIVAKESEGSDKSKADQNKKDEEKEEPIPPGAMKAPEDIEEPSGSEEGRTTVRADVHQNVLGRDFQSDRRRQSTGQAATGDDRVAQFRRPRSAAGDQSFREVRTNSGANTSKPSALHKPVISQKD